MPIISVLNKNNINLRYFSHTWNAYGVLVLKIQRVWPPGKTSAVLSSGIALSGHDSDCVTVHVGALDELALALVAAKYSRMWTKFSAGISTSFPAANDKPAMHTNVPTNNKMELKRMIISIRFTEV